MLTLAAYKVWCVAFATNTLYLFENGKRINDNSVIVTHEVCVNGVYYLGQQFSRNLRFYRTNEPNLMKYDNWRENSLLKDKNCMGYVTKTDEWGKALEQYRKDNKDYYAEIEKRVGEAKTKEERVKIWAEWENKENTFMHKKGFNFFRNPECNKYYTEEYNAYLQQHINSSLYHTDVIIPEPIDKEVGGAREKEVGGVIGTDRCFNVDIETGNVEQIDCPEK